MEKKGIEIISPIAIDMGAKNTGVYLNHFTAGEDPTTSGAQLGKTIVIDSKNITWSQIDRTAKRHQIRSQKRRKLAKRLFRVILQQYDITPDREQLEYLMGLLNNRGYNRIEITEEQEEILQLKAVHDFFYPVIFNHDGNKQDLLDSLQNEIIISSKDDKQKWEGVLNNKIFSLGGKQNKEFKDYLRGEEDIDKESINDLSKAFTAIKKVIQTQIDNYGSGHLHRKKYLENIQEDIENSPLLKPLLTKLNSQLNSEELSYLIGNISNLQLRILRKYFNSEAMKSGDKWCSDKLHRLFFRWITFWHCKQAEEKERQKALLKKGKKQTDILTILSTTDPACTIPPYEDQNNRIKESIKDKTLRLNPTALKNKLPNWQTITEDIVKNYCEPTDNASDVTPTRIDTDINECTHQSIRKIDTDFNQRKLANTLQRILDRSRALDPYKLRLLSSINSLDKNKLKDDALVSLDLLEKHIGDGNIEPFINLCRAYYSEVETAKQGLWSASDESLFFVCNTNPPHKSNIQDKLVSHILRKPISKERLQQFKEGCWTEKIGRKSMKSLAESIEETRKDYGNRFNHIAQTIKRRRYVLKTKGDEFSEDQKKSWSDFEEEHKEVIKAIDSADLVAEEIAKHFGQDDEEKNKYNNPYSIAQLYNHLETNIGGFNKTDKFNTEENAWRDQMQQIETINKKTGEIVTKEVANATRLTKDSVRPFDGMLARILERQAYEIAQFKDRQMAQFPADNESLFIPVFLEQNRFQFEQSLHDVKGAMVSKKTKDKAQKGLEKQKGRWDKKDKRIKANTYCPYTGGKIGAGELDHIVPQSLSKKGGDVVFNSEANLIYCSNKGNQEKGDQRYSFDQLKPSYLKEIFGRDDKESIKQKIREFVEQLDKNNFSGLHTLDEKSQKYLRHALFIPELDSKTFPLLNTRLRTLVNGTQAYLAKLLVKRLRKKYPQADFKVYQIDAYEVKKLRDILGQQYSEYAKQDAQGAFSHVVDAALVLATALQDINTSEKLQTTNTLKLSENAHWLENLLPGNVEIDHIKRKPKYRKELHTTQIFKEGLYGERFLPILLNNEKMYYGFALDNCIEKHPLKLPKQNTKDYDKKLQKNKERQREQHNEYFELLKPFLYTGSTRKKNKQAVTGSLAENQQKYHYLSIDKTKALNHLQRCAKQMCNDIEIAQAKELEKLRYSIKKKKIKEALITGRSNKSFIKELNDKDFRVKGIRLPAEKDWDRLIAHKIKDYLGRPTKLSDCFGKDEQVEIDNPEMVDFWQKLSRESGLEIDGLKDSLLKRNDKGEIAKNEGIIPKGVFEGKIKTDETLQKIKDNPSLEKAFGKSFKEKKDRIPAKSWQQLFEEFFLDKENRKNRGSHHPVRKEYSLPIVSDPSGGFRIKRKNPIVGEGIYQVSEIEGFATKGFDRTLKKPVWIDELRDSPGIAPVAKQYQEPLDEDEVYYFDDWRTINLTDEDELKEKIHSLQYAIGTQDRFYIKVAMPIDNFKRLDESIKNWQEIGAEIKGSGKEKNFQEYFSSDLIGKPRSNLLVEFIDKNKIIFSYTIESNNAEMKTAYQKGTPV